MFCSSCGKELPEGAYFCPKCGARSRMRVEAGVGGPWDEVEEANAGKELVACPSCGEKNVDDARFCYKCGKKLK